MAVKIFLFNITTVVQKSDMKIDLQFYCTDKYVWFFRVIRYKIKHVTHFTFFGVVMYYFNKTTNLFFFYLIQDAIFYLQVHTFLMLLVIT